MKGFLRSKFALSLAALVIIAVIVIVPLSVSAIHLHAAGPSSLKDNVPQSTVASDPFNARLAIQVGTDGRFNIGAYPDSSTGGATSGSWDLMYSWPTPPGTSFSTLNIDGSNSIYGSSGTQIQAPQDIDAKTNQSSWQVGDIQASQTLQLALNDQTAQEDNAKIAYSLINKGTVAHTVGMRVMIDTEVNGNDGAILRAPGTGLVRKESEFTGAAVPDTMQSFFDVTDTQHVAAVTLKSGGATPPDRLVIAAWPHLYDAVYDYTIDPTYDFTDPSVGRPDSAYAVYWKPVSLAPGQSLNYVTYYGLSQLNVDLNPPLALGVSGPATLSVINNAYSPNPFTVATTVLNNGTADANNVALTLHLPTGLSLASGTATQDVGTLPVGQERDVSWSVQAASQTSEQTLTYSVDAVATNTTLKNVARQITLPAISTMTPSPTRKPDSRIVPSPSENYAGYAATGTESNPMTYKVAEAVYKVPAVHCDYPNAEKSQSSAWVGLGDFKNDLEQVGTHSNCNLGDPEYFFVWEVIKNGDPSANENRIWLMHVSPGDTVKVRVRSLGFGEFTIDIWNLSRGGSHWGKVVSGDNSSKATQVAECMQEDPRIVDGSLSPLSHFDPITINCTANNKPIGVAGPVIDQFQMSKPYKQTITSDLQADNKTFTVTRVSS